MPTERQPLAKPADGAYVRKLPHLQVPGRSIFITFVTWKRLVLPESVRQLVLDCCRHDHGTKYELHAAVVMPDHVHLLLTPNTDGEGNTYSLAEIMQGIKGSAAHAVNRALDRKGQVWQAESFDHLLRSDESARSKADYICANPVRAGIVGGHADYPFLWTAWPVATPTSTITA
jgi:REP element-mobilizing transposase RayT